MDVPHNSGDGNNNQPDGQPASPQNPGDNQNNNPSQPTEPPVIQPCPTIQTVGLSVQVKDVQFGAVGDGHTDDTSAIQQAIDYVATQGGGTVNVPKGVYMINPIAVYSVHGLMMRDNVTLRLADDAVIKTLPTDSTHYSAISFIQVKNANLIGGTVIGERYEHTGQGGEWGHGVNIQSSQNIKVQDVTSKDFWGDGFYIGQAYQVWDSRSDNISLCGVTSINNRRQGLSIVDGTNIRVTKSTFSHTNGIAPQAGLDIEPEDGNIVENVEVSDSTFSDNLGDGIVMYRNEQNNAYIKGVRLENNQVLNNKQGIIFDRVTDSQAINNTIRNAGNQTNMEYPMTLHFFEGASDNLAIGNIHIGGKTVDKGTNNRFTDAATYAGLYIRGVVKVGQTVYGEILDTDGVSSSIKYQWYADGVPISGATASSYRITTNELNKVITVTAVFTDLAGHSEQPTSIGARALAA